MEKELNNNLAEAQNISIKKREMPPQFKGKAFDVNKQNINSTGLNRGSKHLDSRIRKILKLGITEINPLTGATEDMQIIDTVIAALIYKAKTSENPKFMEMFLERFAGKVPAQLETKNENLNSNFTISPVEWV